LVIAAGLAELLGWLTKRELFRSAARFVIVIGALGAAASAGLGWATAWFGEHAEDGWGPFSLHRLLGTAAGALIVITAILSELSHRRQGRIAKCTYGLALALSVFLVGLTGYYGGVLIYGPGHHAW